MRTISRRSGLALLVPVAAASCSTTHVEPSSAVQGWLTLLGVAGVVVFLVIVLTQRGRPGFEFSGSGPLRFYLYIASLVGVIVITIGVADLVAVVLTAPFGLETVYGNQTNATDAARFRQEDMLHGITYVTIGGLFWAANVFAQRGFFSADDRSSGVYRTYLFVATTVFGIATIVQLPSGVNGALSQAFGLGGATRAGPSDAYGALAGGLAALPVWLVYLWRARGSMGGVAPAERQA